MLLYPDLPATILKSRVYTNTKNSSRLTSEWQELMQNISIEITLALKYTLCTYIWRGGLPNRNEGWRGFD